MKFQRHWARYQYPEHGGKNSVVARGWSNESLERAVTHAQERARSLFHRLTTSNRTLKQYPYASHPLPEPIIQEGGKEPSRWLLSRNAYGSLILNTSGLFISDIDASSEGTITSFFRRLFGGQAVPSLEEQIEGVLEEQGLRCYRLYRTAHGYRLLVLDRWLDPSSATSDSLHQKVNADPSYRRLCSLQECYRARVSPKPWRCGASKPPVSFPFTGNQETMKFQAWESQYNSKADNYSTCALVKEVRQASPQRDAEEIVSLHDKLSRVEKNLPLA